MENTQTLFDDTESNVSMDQQTAAQIEGLTKRVTQLESGSQLARQIMSILDLDVLLAQAVDLIRTQFHHYFVGVWLVSDKRDFVTLQAGTSHDDDGVPRQGLRIPMTASSSIIKACKRGVYELVDNLASSLDFSRLTLLADVHSELVLPLKEGERVIGVLDILCRRVSAFAPSDVEILQTLAGQLAVAIGNARRYGAEQNRRRLAESLEQSGRELSSSLDLHEMSERVLQVLAPVVSYERGSVILQNNDSMRIVAQHGFPDDARAKALVIPIRPGDVYEQIVASGRPLLLDDVTRDPGWSQVPWLALHRSWLGVPLVAKDKVLGIISLTRREVAAFSPEDATLVSAFAGQAAIALENARLYNELSSAYQTLERLDKTKADFIEIAAHELRTPLTVIKTYTQMLRSRPEVKFDELSAKFLDGVLTGTNRLHRIVNSMLDVTKIESETLKLHKKSIQVFDIIEKIKLEFEDALKERRLDFQVATVELLPLIFADGELLYKAFYNLIVNAIKYTPDGGSIRVDGKILVADKDVTGVEVVVSDTGIGIDPEHHRMIFEKFYQMGEVAVHSSGLTKFKGGGPGLGLAIAKGIILAHEGNLWVESDAYNERLCPGSRFYVHLPV